MMSVFYICNGTNPCCCHCSGCFTKGGECRETTNLKYAVSEKCDDPWNHPERFEVYQVPGYEPYYFEYYDQETEEEGVNDES